MNADFKGIRHEEVGELIPTQIGKLKRSHLVELLVSEVATNQHYGVMAAEMSKEVSRLKREVERTINDYDDQVRRVVKLRNALYDVQSELMVPEGRTPTKRIKDALAIVEGALPG